ncbi:GPGG-motif small membrane protein [Salinispora fenicalii]|nr:GPGG-motif small membrane protein [Salinispora fenicalii]
MELILWFISVVLVAAGILALFRQRILWGIVLIIGGLLVGPGGVNVLS